MAAPNVLQSTFGPQIWVETGSGGSTIVRGYAGGAAGDLLMLVILQDGTGSAPTVGATETADEYEDLAGTADAWTSFGTFDVGSPAAAKLHIYFARALGSNQPGVTVTAGTDDFFATILTFEGVAAGTTVSDILENTTAGSSTTSVGTSNTVADAAVVTTGADRLAVNVIGVNDDNALDAMTGMSGGTWIEPSTDASNVAEWSSSTGTDATIAVQVATMASAGTINGGTDGMAASDAWGVVGFALKPAASGNSVTLEAAVAGTGAVTADTVRTIGVAGTVSGTGAVTVAQTNALALAATVTGAGSIAAALARALPLTADVSGAGAVAATLGRSVDLEASVAGQAAVAADMVVAVALAAAVTGHGAVTADTVRSLALAANAAGAGTVTATAALAVALAATVAGDAVVSPDLTAQGQVPLEADVAGQGAVTVALADLIALQAASTGLSTVAVALQLTNVALAAAIDAGATVSPELVIAGVPTEPSDDDPNVQFFHVTRS